MKDVGPEGTATNGIDLATNKSTGSIIHYTDAARFSKTGTWKEETAVGIVNLFEFKFLAGTAAVPSTAVYKLPVTEDGNYEISLLYKTGPDRALNAPVMIQHADGTANVSWNMRQGSNHGFAVPVGTYRFKEGGNYTVTLGTEGADGKVIADSVAFVKVADDAVLGPAKALSGAKPTHTLKGILIDDREAEAVGDWQEGNLNPLIPPGYLHDDHKGKGQMSLTFQVKVDKPGDYAIRLLYTAHPNRSDNTPSRVMIGGQSKDFKVNQKKSDGSGFLLGTFHLKESVTVEMANKNTVGHVVVDGLQLIPQ